MSRRVEIRDVHSWLLAMSLSLFGCVQPTLEGRVCRSGADCVDDFRCALAICTPPPKNPSPRRLITEECPRFIGGDAAGAIDEALLTDAERIIIIGSILPLTRDGVADVVIEAREAAIALGLTELNRNGGVHGRRIVALSCNSDADTAVGLRAATHLANAGIAVVVGEQSSSRTLQLVQGALLPAGVLTIAPSATSVDLTTLDDDGLLVRTTVSDASQGALLGQLLDDVGATRVTVLAANDSYGTTLAEKLQQTFCTTDGACVGDDTFIVTRFDAGAGAAAADDVDVAAIVARASDSVVVVGEVAQVRALLARVGPAVPQARLVVTDTARRPDLLAGPELLPFSVVTRIVGTAPTALSAGDKADLLRTALLPEHRDASFVSHAYDAAVVAGLLYATVPPPTLHPTGKTLAGGLSRLTATAAPVVSTIGATDGVRDVARGIETLEAGDDINLNGASGPLDFDENGDVSGDLELWRVCPDAGVDQLTSLGTALSADGTFTSLELECSCLLPQLQCAANQLCLRPSIDPTERCFAPCDTEDETCTTTAGVAGICVSIEERLACTDVVQQYQRCAADAPCAGGFCLPIADTGFSQCERMCGSGTLCGTLSEAAASERCGCDAGDDCASDVGVRFGTAEVEALCTKLTAVGDPCSTATSPRILCSFPQACREGFCAAP